MNENQDSGARVSRDCAVFVTHRWTAEIAAHYARLKREAGSVLDVFLAYQQRDEAVAVPRGMQPNLVVRMADSAAYFPLRYEEYRRRPNRWGYLDLVWVTAFLNPSVAAYDRCWLIEYDVDYSGDWANFFGAAAGYEGDLLTARIRPLSADPQYYFAPIYRQPETAPTDPLIAFMPISRLSRRLIEYYHRTLLQPGWHGHFEMVLPSVARAGGYVVAEIGGHDAMTPPERLGLHYDGNFSELHGNDATHAFRPARGFSYYVASPDKFRQPNHIYHPIKAGLRHRLHARWLPQLQQLRAFARWLRGKR